jgi:hypothetical protein
MQAAGLSADSLAIAAIVFAVVFGGAMFGQWLGGRLPDHHRSSQSHDTVKLVTGMTSILAALVLGLLIAGVKSSFDATDTQMRRFATTLIRLDQDLADYGPEATPIRRLLRGYTERALDHTWGAPADQTGIEDREAGSLLDRARLAILALPGGDPHRDALRSGALALVENALQNRWLLIERAGSSIPPLFMHIVIAWVTMIFISFGYNAPRNATVVTSFALGAAALAACIFLIAEMDGPFSGLITISRAPLENALAHMMP